MLVCFQNCGTGFVSKLAAKTTVGHSIATSSTPAPPEPDPTPSIPELKSWDDDFPAAVRVDDCLSNADYNFCVPYKDPVTTAGTTFSPALGPTNSNATMDAKIFVYGLKVPATGTLENANFKVAPTGFALVTPSAGSWKYPYAGDTSHKNAQLSAWYVVNREKAYFTKRSGTFHATAANVGRKLTVRPYRTGQNFQDNAYFDETDFSVNIGYITSGAGDLALDHPVVAHEVGHSNFYSASPASLNDMQAVSCFGSAACCPNASGCVYAIHEGVGDLHAMIMFPDKGGVLGAYWQNSPQGEAQRNLDLAQSNGRTANYFYGLHTGEIHDLGTVYASIWYGVWTKAKVTGGDKDIEILFSEHLSGLGGNDNFITAYTTIGAMADQLFPAKAAAIRASFRAEYQRLGLTVN